MDNEIIYSCKYIRILILVYLSISLVFKAIDTALLLSRYKTSIELTEHAFQL